MIYRELLKSDFDKLPRALHTLHSTLGDVRATGRVTVRREKGLLPLLTGFPRSGEDFSVELEVLAQPHKEIWVRRFGGRVLRSAQLVKGDLLVEIMGPMHIFFRVVPLDSGLRMQSVRARLLGIPIPLRVEATEQGSDSSWEFEVRVAHIGSYRGIMELAA